MEIGETNYLVGETAVKQAGVVLEPSLREDEHTSPESRLLALATLALLAGGPGDHLFYVVTGLPQILMEAQASRVRSMLLGIRQVPVAVNRGGHSYRCTVTVADALVIPQGLGVAFDFALDEDGTPRGSIRFPFPLDGHLHVSGAEVLRKDFLVLDVGFNTALTYALSDTEPMVRFCRGGYHGMAYAYQLVGQARQGQDAWSVQQLIATGRLQPRDYDWAYVQLAHQLNNQVAGFKYPFDFYLIAGGGGAALYPYLLPGVEKKILVPEPQQANARGYRKAGRMKWPHILDAVGS